MKKIHSVIESCFDCQHCKLFSGTEDNHSSVTICNANEGEEFVLVFSETDKNVKQSFDHNIPENCPLETYTNENND